MCPLCVTGEALVVWFGLLGVKASASARVISRRWLFVNITIVDSDVYNNVSRTDIEN